MSARPRVRWWRLVDWRVVAAAGLPIWAVVFGFVAWDKYHNSHPLLSPAVVSVPVSVEPTPVVTQPAPSDVRTPEADEPKVIVVPYPVARPVKATRPSRDVPFWLRDESGEPASLEPTEPQPESACQTFDTAVKFVKSPTEAMNQARRENKLVCVLHLSGNLEDAGFT